MSDVLVEGILVAIFLSVLVSFLFFLRLFRKRWNRSCVARADISEILPFFKKNSPLKTSWVQCQYQFQVRGRHFDGKSVVPLSRFLPAQGESDAMILFDVRIELPILFNDGNRLVGVESIEHYLLQKNSILEIRYLVRDPSKNFFTETEEARKRESKPHIPGETL